MNIKKRHSFYEFFAGGGMAQAGLGNEWKCEFANDFDKKKCATYKINWNTEIHCGDVAKVVANQLPGKADLAWASFPCQDLSLAGNGAGLNGKRSGSFWPFWQLMLQLKNEQRAPRFIVLENVVGLLNSNNGADFAAIAEQFRLAGYRFGAMVIDAALLLPQSRPRLFFIGVLNTDTLPSQILRPNPHPIWHPTKLIARFALLPSADRENWLWWHAPQPDLRSVTFSDLVDQEPEGVLWHSERKTNDLLAMMSDVNRAKVESAQRAAQLSGKHQVGTIYRRTRINAAGEKIQRAEVRFDNVAGCLRTPAGGSSRQIIMLVQSNSIKTRLISARETARLMGLPESYKLPEKYNEAYHLTGDGVAVPVVRMIAEHILEPALDAQSLQAAA